MMLMLCCFQPTYFSSLPTHSHSTHPSFHRYLEVLSVAKTPVLKVDWIYACAKARKQLSYNGFRIPPLAGLVVCVTGVDQARRPALQATVESK